MSLDSRNDINFLNFIQKDLHIDTLILTGDFNPSILKYADEKFSRTWIIQNNKNTLDSMESAITTFSNIEIIHHTVLPSIIENLNSLGDKVLFWFNLIVEKNNSLFNQSTITSVLDKLKQDNFFNENMLLLISYEDAFFKLYSKPEKNNNISFKTIVKRLNFLRQTHTLFLFKNNIICAPDKILNLIYSFYHHDEAM